MQKIFTKEFMAENKGCYTRDKLSTCSFMRKEVITLADILDSEIPLKDKYWFVCNKTLSPKEEAELAAVCAEKVLHIYEQAYPEDDRPRKAVTLAKNITLFYGNINEVVNAIDAAVNIANYFAGNNTLIIAACAARAARAALYVALYNTYDYGAYGAYGFYGGYDAFMAAICATNGREENSFLQILKQFCDEKE